jgi:steroid 5-alpha reductase family enzyme
MSAPPAAVATAQGRARGFALVTLAYVVALGVAAASVAALRGLHPLLVVLGADVAATLAVFGFSYAFGNSSFYDPYWSVAPPLIALYLAGLPQAQAAPGLRQAAVLALVFAWALRLTLNWARGWTGLRHEDWRYVDIRERTGSRYWMASLTGIHLFPTLQVYLGCLALWPALVTGTRPPGWLDALAALVTAAAIGIELVADEQLRAFRRSAPPGAIMASGLWSWSRHPNYFGEILFWWGLGLFALAADPRAVWALVGALAISLMFVTASIPMIERRMGARRPGYAEHARRTSSLIPLPPRRS